LKNFKITHYFFNHITLSFMFMGCRFVVSNIYYTLTNISIDCIYVDMSKQELFLNKTKNDFKLNHWIKKYLLKVSVLIKSINVKYKEYHLQQKSTLFCFQDSLLTVVSTHLSTHEMCVLFLKNLRLDKHFMVTLDSVYYQYNPNSTFNDYD
jgi:hypothetical protein